MCGPRLLQLGSHEGVECPSERIVAVGSAALSPVLQVQFEVRGGGEVLQDELVRGFAVARGQGLDFAEFIAFTRTPLSSQSTVASVHHTNMTFAADVMLLQASRSLNIY